MSVVIDATPLSLDDVVQVARHGERVSLGKAATARVRRSRELLESLLSQDTPIYGVTTGVGELSKTRVSRDAAARLSLNIVLSHACGVGEPLSTPQVRAIMLAAAVNFARGHSGVRIELVQALLDLLNHDVVPWVPGQGGMGSLTHMAHVGLALVGQGPVYHSGQLTTAPAALDAVGLAPLSLVEKEGLSLVNGTVSKTGLAALTLVDARRLAAWCDVVGAMSFEALRGVPFAFDARLHEARPHPGQTRVAANLLRLIQDSDIVARYQHDRVQDALSLRAMPQVHGACRDSIEHAVNVATTELNSATDNPLIFERDGKAEVRSGCNAHGEPMALALEALGVALAELANISERRTDRLVNHYVSGLPAFLVQNSGVSSGFMIPQYVAASLVAENKVLAHPLAVDSIPTTALQEDHWSMGTPAALKAQQILRNAQKVVAIELLTACQALEFHRPLQPGLGTRTIFDAVRQVIPAWEEDRVFYPDLHRVIAEVEDGAWLRLVEGVVGPLT
jgi:histidine ammonia-lyase